MSAKRKNHATQEENPLAACGDAEWRGVVLTLAGISGRWGRGIYCGGMVEKHIGLIVTEPLPLFCCLYHKNSYSGGFQKCVWWSYEGKSS